MATRPKMSLFHVRPSHEKHILISRLWINIKTMVQLTDYYSMQLKTLYNVKNATISNSLLINIVENEDFLTYFYFASSLY